MEGRCVGVIVRFVPNPMEILRRMSTDPSFLERLVRYTRLEVFRS
jgi:hypothetical protein